VTLPAPSRTPLVLSALAAAGALAFLGSALWWRYGQDAAPAPVPAASVRLDVEEARVAAAEVWRRHDRGSRSKESLAISKDECLSVVALGSTAPLETRMALREVCITEALVRAAPLINPASRADGRALLPSPDAPQCIVWGSMWANDPETVEALRAIGFRSIRCRERVWDL
jgi:hypothetical protein